ncbi:SDR family oxidoreductase [Reichenbachiella versicolor]|uniref:SDR family oxidoreductase n=1 Tax=Reichenbachiella versicolor TaxID=1821036 RepID=UPI000D6E3E7E|nr:SDR family oxidoreductase [Reichenbachiella versicolor]
MKILLTGATGYIGKRLLPALIKEGHHVVCCVRDKNRFSPPTSLLKSLEIIEVDFLDSKTLVSIPNDIDAAYYLMHSMSSSTQYETLEKLSAMHFKERISQTKCEHVLYLSGIINQDTLSQHLASRKAVEEELATGSYHFTALRAGIIIGSGSASFEIIRDLVEKLPVMITPRWLNTKCQPIGVQDVISFLTKSLFKKETYDKNFDIGGPDILSYKEMLLGYAHIRGLRRWIGTLPVMTPRLSSYWLFFVTSTSYKLAVALVNSMKVEVICRESNINQILNITPISYHEALKRTLLKVVSNQIVSSWKDSLVSGRFKTNISEFLTVPSFGCFKDERSKEYEDLQTCKSKLWSIGGDTGWYYADWLWKIRGFIDKLAGGVGLRRGRTHLDQIEAGDAVDFWRVLYSNRQEGRLLLFAEMRLPGEAWLEFKICGKKLTQTATFRPKGLWGRIYWWSVYPFHGAIFEGMLRQLTTI